MYSKDEIRTWSTDRIRSEIDDQKDWIREARRDRADVSAANEYLFLLYEVLDER